MKQKNVNWDLISKWITDIQAMEKYAYESENEYLHTIADKKDFARPLIELIRHEMNIIRFSWIRRCTPLVTNPHDPFKFCEYGCCNMPLKPSYSALPGYSKRFFTALVFTKTRIPIDVIFMILSYAFRITPRKIGPVVNGEQWYYKPL